MATGIMLHPSADRSEVQERREQLAALRRRLLQEEEDLAQLRSKLRAFESTYFRQVGVLYAELDELEARIAEREVDLYDSDAARERAETARQRAQQTRDAASADSDEEPEEIAPAPELRTLFRELARRIHPDYARDETETRHLTLLMARANQAYRRGDAETLQRLLDDQSEIAGAVADEGSSAEAQRLLRQIRHVQRDLAALEAERHTLRTGDLAHLQADAEAAALEHRDLLAELAAGLQAQIADAHYRFQFIDRQIAAHGR